MSSAHKFLIAAIAVLAYLAIGPLGQTPGPNAAVKTTTIPLDRPNEQQPRNVKTEWVTYKGRKGLRVIDAAPPDVADGIQLVILNETDFRDGTIEIELTGEPSPTAKSAAPRGFVGVAFRVNLDAAKDAAKYDCFYLRPTNGRADDQVRRNHSTQYISYPDFPWFRLRKEFPEKYESYADVVPGEWTKLKIEVYGDKARLYVQGAPQPALVVNDLKQTQGKIALWVGTETDRALRQSTRITVISRISGAIDISSGYTGGYNLPPNGSWIVRTLVEAAQVEQNKGWM